MFYMYILDKLKFNLYIYGTLAYLFSPHCNNNKRILIVVTMLIKCHPNQ